MNLKKAMPWAAWLGRTCIGYTVFFSLFWIPLGLHRATMRQRDWWHFPVYFLIGLLGLLGWRYAPSQYWILFAAPYMFSLTRDFWTLWLWAWPQEHTPIEHFAELNKRHDLSAHIAMGIALFVILVLLFGKK